MLQLQTATTTAAPRGLSARRRFQVAQDPRTGRPLLFRGRLVLVVEHCAACGLVVDVHVAEPEALAVLPPLCPACRTGGHVDRPVITT